MDTLAWVAERLEGRVGFNRLDYITAEILTGQSAILLRFPSGGERYLYLDEEPLIEAEGIRADLDAAEAERIEADRLLGECGKDLESTQAMVRRCRRLLDRIAATDADLPAWVRDEATGFLDRNPAP